MLMLKIVDKDRRAYGGFQWPESGPVECPDWDPRPKCGGGLHGWESGEGSYRHSFNDGVFLVVRADDADVLRLDGKVKIRRGEVVYCGTREGAVRYLVEHGALTEKSGPAWACLAPQALVTVAMRSADRAVRRYAVERLRQRGRIADADKLAALPEIKDRASALEIGRAHV